MVWPMLRSDTSAAQDVLAALVELSRLEAAHVIHDGHVCDDLDIGICARRHGGAVRMFVTARQRGGTGAFSDRMAPPGLGKCVFNQAATACSVLLGARNML
jgi:hypothetical protein